jgi:NCAIR mutase (PurE)-related protein
MAEAVYAPGKTPEQCAAIVAELLEDAADVPVLLTRAQPEQVAAALATSPAGSTRDGQPHTVVWRTQPMAGASVLVLTGGTADLPVAAEAVATLEAHGIATRLHPDVGVAGLQRLLALQEELVEADAVVVAAGMEGALPSVVSGLTPVPVIALPTSTGYGAALEGITALLAMLSSCAAGVTVVGIDNGYGAGCAVVRLLPPRRG